MGEKVKTIVYDDYTITSTWSDEDESFVARVLDYASLATHGDTHDEAIEQMIEVLDLIIDAAIDAADRRWKAVVNWATKLHSDRYASDSEYRLECDKREQDNKIRISKLRKLVFFGEEND